MESLNRLRTGHNKINSPNIIASPVSGHHESFDEYDKDISEILADPKEHNLFINKFLYAQDPVRAQAIAGALADNQVLNPKEEKWLETQREAYNKRSFEVAHSREMLSADTLERLAELDPKIKVVVGKIGPEKAAEFLGNEFGELAFSDAKLFKKMTDAMHEIHEVHTRPSSLFLERQFRSDLFKYGISEADYISATAGGLTLNTKAKLETMVASQYGLFRKTIDFISIGALSSRGGRKLYQDFHAQKNLLDEIDSHMKVVGKTLAMTLNSDTKLAIQKFMVEGGSLQEKKQKEAVNSIGSYRDARDSMEKTSIQTRFDAYVKAEAKKKRQSPNYQPLRDQLKDSFATEEFSRQAELMKSTSLFGILISMLFRTKDDIKTSLK